MGAGTAGPDERKTPMIIADFLSLSKGTENVSLRRDLI